MTKDLVLGHKYQRIFPIFNTEISEWSIVYFRGDMLEYPICSYIYLSKQYMPK